MITIDKANPLGDGIWLTLTYQSNWFMILLRRLHDPNEFRLSYLKTPLVINVSQERETFQNHELYKLSGKKQHWKIFCLFSALLDLKCIREGSTMKILLGIIRAIEALRPRVA